MKTSKNTRHHTKLNKHDRNEIKILLNRGYSLSEIARVMKRSKSTVSYELSWNSRSVKGRYGPVKEYNPRVANQKAYTRRKYAKFQGQKIMNNLMLGLITIFSWYFPS